MKREAKGKAVKSMKGIQEVKGNTPRYFGDTPIRPNYPQGTPKQVSVKMGKVPNKNAKSFE